MTPFELSETLISQIRTAMENQEQVFVLDSESVSLVAASEVDLDGDPDRYMALPIWTSIQGFGLMEAFVTSLHNPLVKQELQTILKSGRGVFRGFKACLKEHPAVAQLWHRFKDQELRRHILLWYNDYREFWGLARLAEDLPGDDNPLVLEDFEYGPGDSSIDEVVHHNLKARYLEAFQEPSLATHLYHRAWTGCTPNHKLSLIARLPDGTLAGYVALCSEALSISGANTSLVRLMDVWVEPAYRGVGLGSYLLARALSSVSDASDTPALWVLADLPANPPWLARMLEHRDMVRVAGTYLLR